MFYLIMLLKIALIEYILIFLHEFVHFIASLFIDLKCTFYYVFPFTLYKKNNRFKLQLSPRFEKSSTSRMHFESIKLTSNKDYDILLKRLKIFLWSGPIFDFLSFIILFCIGLCLPKYFFLTLTALVHFAITTLNFFNSDGKYAIGSKENPRIAFDLVRDFTLCGSGKVSNRTKEIMTNRHIEVSSYIDFSEFDVHDLWNFLNNLSFYTNSLLSYINKDLLYLDESTESFLESLIQDFDKIQTYDYRQIPKTSISIILYFIFTKIQYKNFIPEENILNKIYSGCSSDYYKKLIGYYFYDEYIYKDYLLNEKNMPIINLSCPGYNKLLISLINKKSI
ncbi:hypothetical protein OIM93_12915 [Clostridium chauvoei]|uniref:hypothetical protein n=2 Tax=Clostridium chauvoei TaxID=46867 RepID=UPI00389EE921